MRDFRLKSLEIYNQLDVPPWGPDLTDLDIENIVTYVKPPRICNIVGMIYLKILRIPLSNWVSPSRT